MEELVKDKKTCNKCLVEQDFSGFYKKSKNIDGYENQCKKCRNLDALKRHKVNKLNRPLINYDKIILKFCGLCSIEKTSVDFHKSSYTSDGYQTHCKTCDQNRSRDGKAQYQKIGKPYYFKNKQKIRERERQYRHENKEKLNKKRREFYLQNKQNINAQRGEYRKKRKKFDIKYNLDSKMGSAISVSLRGNKNNRHWENLVNYTVFDLKKHLEFHFTKDMTWQDLLEGRISIDHILPKELFEYESSEDPQFKICWSLNNLQPLWKEENIQKSDMLPNGKRARFLSKVEKLEYLKSLGYQL